MINYKVDNKKLLVNCTPIYENIVDRSPENEEGLRDFILSEYKKLKEKPNLWESGGLKEGRTSYFEEDLFKSNNPFVKEIENVIYDEVQKYYDWITELSFGSESFDIGIQAFFQVMEKGDWHMYHNHSSLTNTTFLSGCFYIDGGDAGKEFGGQFKPVLNPYMIQEGDENSVDITPVSNKIIMFPSYMFHEVSPYFGDKKRIVLAFNVYKEN